MLEVSFLIIGDGGTGKTRFIEQLPKPIVYDFDKGTASIRDPEIRKNAVLFKDAPRGRPSMPARGIYDYGTGWTKLIETLNEHGKLIDKGTFPYETLCFDSLTMLSDLCLNNVLKTAGHSGNVEIQHWGAQLRALQSLIEQITSWPLTKYVTAHVQRNENKINETTEMLPLVYGKLAGKVHLYFDEVYYTKIDTRREGQQEHNSYRFITQSTALIKQARSRHSVPTGIEQDWKKLSPYFSEASMR